MTTIRYFIPEDGDEEAYPNVFLAPKSRNPGAPPLLGQVKDAFPLPGTYHFRFKSPLFPGGDREKGAMAVWMDTVNDNAYVPTWKNSIVAKVTRINMDDDDDDDDDDFVGRGTSNAAPAPAPSGGTHSAPTSGNVPRAPPSTHSSTGSASDHLDIFDSAPASNTHHPPAPPSGTTANLLDGHHTTPTPSPVPAAPTSSGGSLLDMDGFGGSTTNTQGTSSAHSDFLGMTAPAPTPATATQTPARPPQAATPAGGGYPNPYGQTPGHQQPPPQQQPQRPPQQQQAMGQANAFANFSNQQGPFGGLGTPWK